MKKISKIALAIVALFTLFTVTNVSAKKMTLEEIGNITARTTSQGKVKRNIYISNGYVYVNTFSIYDLNRTPNTYIPDDEHPIPPLYYQDGAGNWSNIVEPSETVDKTKTIDVVAIVGELREGYDHISEDETFYEDGSFKGMSSFANKNEYYKNDKRMLESFASSNEIKVTGVRLDTASIGNAKQDYNTARLNDNGSTANKLNITEEKPLLAFDNGFKTAKWFGVLVETNRPLAENEINSVLKVYVVSGVDTREYTINPKDLDSSNHNGKTNEFVMWLRAEDFENNTQKQLIFVNEINGEMSSTTVEVEYTAFDGISFEVAGTALTNLPEDVTSTLVDDTNVVYSNKDLTEVRFTQDDTAKAAFKEGSDWKVVPVFDKTKLDAKKSALLDLSEEDEFNLSHITVTKEEATEGADLVLNITADDLLKLYDNVNVHGNYAWLGLVLNLGLDPQYITLNDEAVDYKDVVRHGGVLNEDFNEWLGVTNAEKTMKLTYVNSQYAKDKVVVKVKFIPANVTPFKVEDIKAITTSYDDDKATALTNALVNYNNEAITTSGHVGGKLTIDEINPLIAYDNGVAEAKWFGLIVTPNKKLTVEDLTRYTFKIGGVEYTVNPDDIGVGAEHYGAKADEFIIWLKAENLVGIKDLTVYENGVERQTINIEFVSSHDSSFYFVSAKDSITASNGLATNVTGVTASVETTVLDDENQLNIFTLTGNVNETTTEVYLQGDDKKAVVKDAEGVWSIKDMMDIPEEESIIVPGNAVNIDKWGKEHQWNQNAISEGVVVTENTDDEDVDYDVTITTDEFLYAYENNSSLTGERAWLSIIINLGLDPQYITLNGEAVDYKDVVRHGGELNAEFVEWLGFEKDEDGNYKTKNVTYQNTLVPSDKVTFRIKLICNAKTVDIIQSAQTADPSNNNTAHYTVSKLIDGVVTINEKDSEMSAEVTNGDLGNAKWINLTFTLSNRLDSGNLAKYELIINDDEDNSIKLNDSNRVTYVSGRTYDTIKVWFKAEELAPTAKLVLREVENTSTPITVEYNAYFDAKIAGVNADASLYSNDALSDELANAYNELFKQNMNALHGKGIGSISSPSPRGNHNTYNLTIISLKQVLNKIPFVKDGKLVVDEEGNVVKHQRIGLIVDLGVDPSKLTSKEYTISEDDYNTDSKLNAIDKWKPTEWEGTNSFIMWIDETFNGKTVTFTYTDGTEVKAVKINIVINQPEAVEWITEGFDGTTLLKEYDYDLYVDVQTDGVDFDSNSGIFVVKNNLTEFVASIDGVSYTYTKTTDGTWTMRKNIVVEKVQKSKANEDLIEELYPSEEQRDNLNAIDEITNVNNTITIKLNKLLPLKDVTYKDVTYDGDKTAKLIPVVVDLGINPAEVVTEGYKINPQDYEDAYRHAGLSSKEGAENLVVLWIDADKALNDGVTIKVAHIDDSVQFDLVIKAEYNDTKTDLEALLTEESNIKEIVIPEDEEITLEEELTIANAGATISGKGTITGKVKIDAAGVKVEGVTITGDVTIAKDATLNGTEITGKVDVQGKAEMTDVTITGDVTVAKEATANLTDATVTGKVDVNGTVIVNGGDTSIKNTAGDVFDVAGGANLTINNGTFQTEADDTVLINNEKNGTVVIENGTFNHFAKDSQSGLTESYYAIINHGDMTINGGKFDGTNEKLSSLITNGYYDNGVEGSKLKITAGTFIGGLNTIKNDNFGVLEITGGEFSGAKQAVVLTANEATISGGTFDSTGAKEHILVVKLNDSSKGCKGVLNLAGGEFKGKGTSEYVIVKHSDSDANPTVNFTLDALTKDEQITNWLNESDFDTTGLN